MAFKRIGIVLSLAAACIMAAAQDIKVRGIVQDKEGAIVGATVKVKGAKEGTVTDVDGRFSLNAPKGAVIEVTYMGYSAAERKINGRQAELVINMEENMTAIDEVVVTAIGIKQQKKKIGYTTQEVKADIINQPGTINVGNALSGQVAGLSVDNPTGLFQAPTFTLRGKTPLMVIDGIPVETDLYDVSAENIESVNVLKGTAAAALYGSRGKDGAILITTKMAERDGLSINVGVSTMITAGFTVFPETQSQFGSGSNGQYAFWDGADGGVSDGDMTWGPAFNGQKIAQWNSPIRNKETGETIDWWGDVSGTIYDDQSKYERVPIDWTAHDNLKDFLRTGVIAKTTFGVTNKSKRSNISFNGDFAKQRGQAPNTSVYTGGMNFNGMFDISSALTLTASLSNNKVYSPNYPRYGYGPRNYMYTILLWMGNDVDGKELKAHHWRPDSEGTRQANYNYAWYNNPYFMTSELTQKHDRNVMNGQLKLNWDALPGLSLQGRASGRLENLFEDMKIPKSYMNYGDSRNGDYKTWNTDYLDVNADFLATYTKAFSKNLAFTVNAGTSLYYRRIRKESQATDGLIVAGVYNMGNSMNSVSATNSMSEKAIESIYASVNADLLEAVYLTFTGRNDWSSTLAKGNNSYFYPSVSLSTLVDQYMRLPSWIDYLKMSAAWAQVSSDLDPYSLYAAYSNGTRYGTTPSVTYTESLANSNVLPQKSTSFEIGLSTAFLRGRIGLEIAAYHIVDKNNIIQLPISESSGFSTRYVNGNTYTTNGLELVATAVPVKAKGFSWNITSNWSTSVRKLTEIYGGQEKYGDLKKGDRADAIYATEWQKSADGQLILNATTGLPVKNTFKSHVGNADPDVRYGFQNTFKAGRFTVNVDIDGAIGGTLVSTTIKKMWWGGKHPKSVMYRQEEYDNGGKAIYVPEGVNIVSGEATYDSDGNLISDTRQYQKNTTAVNIQTWCQNYPYVASVSTSENKTFANTFSRSFMKLRRLAVTYDLTPLLHTRAVKGLDVTLYGSNLLVLKKTPYTDPDFGSSDDGLQDPSARYIGLSANIRF